MKATLHIVGCSRTKIWDKESSAPDYVPAKHAYKGRGFLKALTQVKQPWIVLSGKYGFIESSHPICRYDIKLGGPYSVSDKTLRIQVLQERAWHLTPTVLVAVRLADYSHIVCLNCDKTYIEKIRKSFYHERNKIHLRSKE